MHTHRCVLANFERLFWFWWQWRWYVYLYTAGNCWIKFSIFRNLTFHFACMANNRETKRYEMGDDDTVPRRFKTNQMKWWEKRTMKKCAGGNARWTIFELELFEEFSHSLNIQLLPPPISPMLVLTHIHSGASMLSLPLGTFIRPKNLIIFFLSFTHFYALQIRVSKCNFKTLL